MAGGLEATSRVTVHVRSSLTPQENLLAELRLAGLAPNTLASGPRPPFTGTCHTLDLGGGDPGRGERLFLYVYKSPEQLQRDAEHVSADGARLFGKPIKWPAITLMYRRGPLLALYAGSDGRLVEVLNEQFGPPFAVGKPDATLSAAPAETSRPAGSAESAAREVDQLIRLYEAKKLLTPQAYPTLRKIFADRFEREHGAEIRAGLALDYEPMQNWFSQHPEIKEEFFIALQPEFDNVPAALALFNQLRQRYPDKIVPYANLAIATAVTWDTPDNGVYDYGPHQRRTRSELPEGMLGALDNFQYFTAAQRAIQGRAQLLPWEFLTLLVDHRTPSTERNWAVKSYLAQAATIGACYKDVPYDYEMLNSQGEQCRLAGKPYTLENIRQFGGVCAMQADFAARVAKCLGAPAAYVGGDSNSGDTHAWVMWVALRQVTGNAVDFRLESYGRYRGDQYYVGNLRDPQTGQRITDRELELRLETIGANFIANRQANLLMRVFRLLKRKVPLDVTAQLQFLNGMIALSPGNEQAWRAVAAMAKDGGLTPAHFRQYQSLTNRLFDTFARLPDFTWTIFDDLISYYDPRRRIEKYEQLKNLYVAAKRPDLACEAQLKLTDYLLKDKQRERAVEELAEAIRRFPDEGRYVPHMLDRLEETSREVSNAQARLVRFYQVFLPTIPKRRGDAPSKYCMAMYERGIALFKQAGDAPDAARYQSMLDEMRKPQKTSR